MAQERGVGHDQLDNDQLHPDGVADEEEEAEIRGAVTWGVVIVGRRDLQGEQDSGKTCQHLRC